MKAEDALPDRSIEKMIRSAHERMVRAMSGPNIQIAAVPVEPTTEADLIKADVEAAVRERTQELSNTRLRLSTQYKVACIMAESTNTGEAVRNMLNVITEHLLSDKGVVWASYWTTARDSSMLKCIECLQIPAGAFADFEQTSKQFEFGTNMGLSGRVFTNAQAMQVASISREEDVPRLPLPLRHRLRSAMAFPVISNDQVEGVFEFFAEQPIEINDEMIAMLQSFGQQIGQFMVKMQLETDRQHLASIVQYSNDAIFSTSVDNVVTSWNRGAERLFGYTAQEIKGQNISVLIPADSSEEFLQVCRRVEQGEVIDAYETQCRRKGGKLVDVSITWSPILDENGVPVLSSATLRDITERKEAERRISEFYSTVSHELRTPITSIRGAIGLIEGGVVAPDSPESKELLQAARESADRLIRLINDMLDLRKIEAGKLELKRTNVSAAKLVDATVKGIKAMADAVSVNLSINVESDSILFVDCDRIVQLMTNLVSNAIKISNVGDTVEILVNASESNRTRFSVTDHGTGIAQEEMHKLFGKFQQLDSSDSRKQEGTGLGLAISKAIAEEHGGNIGVESEFGTGSTFWFELISVEHTDSLEPATPIAKVDVRVASDRYVLVVEDDADLRKVLDCSLRSQGFRSVAASCLSEALVRIQEAKPSVVLLDLNLPDGNGLNLIELLKNNPETSDIPIIVITGQHRDDQTLGEPVILDWLTKPFKQDVMLRAVHRALPATEAMSVLIVDDDASTRTVLSTQLKADGISCLEAADGAAAIHLMRTQRPDLMILDLDMPRPNGFEVVDILRQERSKSTPLIIYSGKDLEERERASLTLGLTRYLTKGCTSQHDFLVAVNSLLGKLAAEKETQND